MKIEHISSAADGGDNEDLIAVYETDGLLDIVVIDGGSSVADQDFIDPELGDVVWFVKHFASCLGQAISKDRSQEDSLLLALGALRAEFQRKTAGVTVPLYAFPIGAMTWARISEGAIQLYCLGDCKAFLLQPDQQVVDIDPYVNPQELVLQQEIEKLSNEGINDSASRKERLMPMLRARRGFLNSCPSPFVLCLQPNGPINARRHTVPVDADAMLLMMTDGFYRLVDPYGLRSIEDLAQICARDGLETALAELRGFEAASKDGASVTVKSADDASAVTWRSGSPLPHQLLGRQ